MITVGMAMGIYKEPVYNGNFHCGNCGKDLGASVVNAKTTYPSYCNNKNWLNFCCSYCNEILSR